MTTPTITDEMVAERVQSVRQWVMRVLRSRQFLYHLGRSALTSTHAGNDTPRMENLHAWLYMIVSATMASSNLNLYDDDKWAVIQAEMAWTWDGWFRHHHVPSYSAIDTSMPLTWYTTTVEAGLPGNRQVLRPVADSNITMLSSFSRPDTFDDFMAHHAIHVHPPAEDDC